MKTNTYTDEEAYMILCPTRSKDCTPEQCKTCGWRKPYKVKFLSEPIPRFNYDGESDRDFYTNKCNWIMQHLKEIDIDDMAEHIVNKVFPNTNIKQIELIVDIGNVIYAYLQETRR